MKTWLDELTSAFHEAAVPMPRIVPMASSVAVRKSYWLAPGGFAVPPKLQSVLVPNEIEPIVGAEPASPPVWPRDEIRSPQADEPLSLYPGENTW